MAEWIDNLVKLKDSGEICIDNRAITNFTNLIKAEAYNYDKKNNFNTLISEIEDKIDNFNGLKFDWIEKKDLNDYLAKIIKEINIAFNKFIKSNWDSRKIVLVELWKLGKNDNLADNIARIIKEKNEKSFASIFKFDKIFWTAQKQEPWKPKFNWYK